MKLSLIGVLAVIVLLLLSACGGDNPPAEPTDTMDPQQSTPTPAPTLQPLHSPLYLENVPVEDVIRYFNEVCLDSEFVNSGDPSFVQKWTSPIFYTLEGDYTDADLAALHAFDRWLNGIDGFPGISQTEDVTQRNLRICFCTQQEMVTILGSDFEYMDGGVTFWYENNAIYDAIICIRTDLDQTLRNSVILEELYNGLGPIQDTSLRTDSLIYQEFSQPQWMTPVDMLILRLLYHPEMLPGMDAAQCEQVIGSLYY